MVLKRIGVWSLCRVLAVWYALIGLLVGGIFTIISLVGAAAGMASGEKEAAFGLLFGAGAIVAAPILYGILGLIVGALGAVFYNLTAQILGGVELDLEPIAPSAPTP